VAPFFTPVWGDISRPIHGTGRPNAGALIHGQSPWLSAAGAINTNPSTIYSAESLSTPAYRQTGMQGMVEMESITSLLLPAGPDPALL